MFSRASRLLPGLFVAVISAGAAFSPMPAAAQVGSACGTSGAFGAANPTSTIQTLMNCNSGTWAAAPVQIGSTAATCNSTAAGTVQWTGTVLKYCDGSAWQTALSAGSGVSGSGSAGYDAIWTGTTAIGTGLLYESGGSVGIGTAAPQSTLDVNGGIKVANSAASCTSATNGLLKYISGSTPPWQYCNGSAWLPFNDPQYAQQTAAQISVGLYHVLALKSDGSLYGWGWNGYGQLGNGNTTLQVSAVAAGTNFAGPWAQINAGPYTSCGIKLADNSLWCWGYNIDGQIGDGTTTNRTTTPPQIAGTWNEVSTGGRFATTYGVASMPNSFFTCGVKSDNSGWCWGNSSNGQVDIGTTTQQLSPVQVTGSWSGIWTGLGYHACGIRTDGTLWCWGWNGYGQLGNGTTTDSWTPVEIGTAAWSSVALGDINTCAVKSDNTLWCWGNSSSYQIGNGSTAQQNSPVQIGTANWSKVRVVPNSTSSAVIAFDLGGNAWGWGYNIQNLLLIGSLPAYQTTPKQFVTTDLPALTGASWTDIKSMSNYVCGIRDDATVWCWGVQIYGRLGYPSYDQITAVGGN